MEEKILNQTKVSSKVLMIPKFRFDEINERYKKYKRETVLLESKIEEMERENKKLSDDIICIKNAYDKALLNLQVKETFVEGGILKEQYETIIPKMTCNDKEKLDLARAIVQVITQKQ